MFRLNFWSPQSLSGPMPNPVGLPPFYSGPLVGLPSHPPLVPSRPLYPPQLLSSGSSELLPSCNPAADFGIAAASLWRNGLSNFDHPIDNSTKSPDAKKRLSPQEFDPPAAMTSFPVGPSGAFDYHVSPSDELRHSLLLRTQLAALRQFQQQQQQQLDSAELAKYQLIDNRYAGLPVTCSSPDPPAVRRAESATITGSEVEAGDGDTMMDRKQLKNSADVYKRCGSARSDDSVRSRDSKIRRIRSPASSVDELHSAAPWRGRVTSPQVAATAGDPAGWLQTFSTRIL
jgi:hypothetical protein